MKTLEQLSQDSFYNMQNYSQLTIDLIQEAEEFNGATVVEYPLGERVNFGEK